MNDNPIVVFDCGGVLGGVDLEAGNVAIASTLGVDLETYKTWCRQELLWERYEVGQLSTGQVLAMLREAFGSNPTNSALTAAIQEVVRPQNEETLDLVKRLHDQGYPLAILSNTNPVHWEKVLREYEAVRYFPVLGASHLLGYAKPSRSIFTALEGLVAAANFDVRHFIFFDDVSKYVAGAQDAGWYASQFLDAAQAEQLLGVYGVTL